MFVFFFLSRFYAPGDQSGPCMRRYDKHLWIWKSFLPKDEPRSRATGIMKAARAACFSVADVLGTDFKHFTVLLPVSLFLDCDAWDLELALKQQSCIVKHCGTIDFVCIDDFIKLSYRKSNLYHFSLLSIRHADFENVKTTGSMSKSLFKTL